ncbi:MAG: lipoyl(octanoyl) transferase [Anaerolineae bacterium]|nr:lipoyl(octanoyl) transferase [Anaerolineae bacterium]MBL8104343.1 lipoyl(octanoyl) transferase [Anaerolineales bacterium]MCC7189686.1 lipoyl(octanoyl) transferase [Anaerolineales bacterium]
MNFVVEDLGLIEYESAWKLQDQYAEEIAEGKRPPTLLLLEHPHVYTFGRRGKQENLLWGESQLKEKGIAIHWVDRGGDVTYHGPGQLVGYPLLPLIPLRPHRSLRPVRSDGRIPEADYVGYVRKLEQTIITALARLGLAAGQRQGLTGVWIQADVHSRCPRCSPEDRKKPAKIAAIGIKVDARGVSRHGFALNVNPDMEYWDGIIACGLQDEPIVSLADLFPEPPSMERVKEEIVEAFHEIFGVVAG